MFHTLRFRLTASLILIVVAAVGITTSFGVLMTSQMLKRYKEYGWSASHERFEVVLTRYYAQHESWAGVQPQVEQIEQITGERVILADAAGQIVADSSGELVGQPAADQSELVAPAALVSHNGATVGVIYTALPGWGVSPGRDIFLAPANRALLLVAAAAGLGAILLIWGLSRRILGPVEALTAAARRMEAGDLSQRVDIVSQDEIGDLARAFNAMADGLARLEELRRNMVTDVAHELRTPLSNIRGYLEALQDGVVAPEERIINSLHEEALLLNRLVDDLQELALAEAGQLRLERRPTELAPLVQRAVEALRPQAAAGEIALHTALPEDLPRVDVDPRRIAQVLRNLLDNALRHTPSGGKITIAARPGGGWVTVSVRDTGTGIAAEDLPYIFERFYRADKSRARATGGAGLGLAITRQLVETHGGQIKVESDGPGQGTQFTFTLPVAGESGT